MKGRSRSRSIIFTAATKAQATKGYEKFGIIDRVIEVISLPRYIYRTDINRSTLKRPFIPSSEQRLRDPRAPFPGNR